MQARLTVVSVFVVIMVATSGCVIKGRGKTIAYGVDGATAALGLGMLIDAGSADCTVDDPFGAPLEAACKGAKGAGMLLGTSLLAAGGISLIINALVNAGTPRSIADKPSSAAKKPAAPPTLDFGTHPTYPNAPRPQQSR